MAGDPAEAASELVIRLPQPVPLDLLPLASSSSQQPGSQWTSLAYSHATTPASPSKSTGSSQARTLKRPDAGSRSTSHTSLRSRTSSQPTGSSSPATSFIDTGSSDEEADAKSWPSTTPGRPGEPPVVRSPAPPSKKPSLWQRALGGAWRQKMGNKSAGFLASLKRRGGVFAKRVRLSSRAPKELIPKTWGEYRRAYAAREIDIDDPPPPPPKPVVAPKAATAEPELTPYEAKAFFAPRPTNEVLRQNTVNRVDLVGKSRGPARAAATTSNVDYEPGSIKEQDVCRPTPRDEMGATLKSHPAFKRIVAFARQTFGTKFSMLSVLDDDQQIFLAESGLGGMEGIPRDIGFCAHTLLSSTRGLVILDTHKDWRFGSTPLVTQYGSRFYAGVPLLAPREAAYTVGGSMPIGTLCVVDDKPRETFSDLDRRRLVGLANYARTEIETWVRAKMELKLAAMDKSYKLLRANLPRKPERLETLFEGNTPEASPRPPTVSGSPAIPASDASAPMDRSGTEQSTGLAPPPSATEAPSSAGTTASELSTDGEDVDGKSMSSAATSISPAARTYAMALRLVAETLFFDLVYLVRLGLPAGAPTPADEIKVALVAAHGLPKVNAAQFDPALHVKALRAPERGLLYQNPRREELKDGEQFPAQEYASALLVPIVEDDARGFVMAAYTSEASRVLGVEDLLYMQSIAKELVLFLDEEP